MIRVAFTMIGGGAGTGAYNYLLNLVRLLCEHEADRIRPVLLFGSDTPAEDAAPFRAVAGADLVFSPAMDRARRGKALARAVFLGADAQQRALLQAQQIDVLFENAQFFGWRIGVPVIAWIPDFQHRHLRHMFTRRGYWKRELGFLAQMASGRTIMLSSEDARRDCERFYPSAVGRTRAVRFAVSAAQGVSRTSARAKADAYGLPEHFFFMPNQLSKHKNHLLVLEALALLRARGGSVVVVSSGKQADERHPEHFPAVQARLRELALEHEFRLLGMIPYGDLAALMQASVALLNPSLFEGWSTPVEEARALGVPLLLSDLDVHREQAADSATYFARHSADALADALQQFMPLSVEAREAAQLDAKSANAERVRRFVSEFANLTSDCVGMIK